MPPIPAVPTHPLPGASPDPGFFCHQCGAKLVVRDPSAAKAGPCPVCGAWLTPPSAPSPTPPLVAAVVAPVADPAQECRRRGHIRGDLNVDVVHLERRETARTLIVIAMFVVAAGVCAVIFYLMTGWGG
jgi:hypothetical protein